MRESESAVAALGRNPDMLRMRVLIAGGASAGLSGGLLVEYVTAWGPASWLYAETFLFFTALIIGGRGNLAGGALGTLLVPIVIIEATRHLPAFGYPGLIDSLDWVVIGACLLVFLWFRPNGLLPERKRVLRRPGDEPGGPGATGGARRMAGRAAVTQEPGAAAAPVVAQAAGVAQDPAAAQDQATLGTRPARGTRTSRTRPCSCAWRASRATSAACTPSRTRPSRCAGARSPASSARTAPASPR